MTQHNLYVHIPFCLRRCYYCDFTSSQLDSALSAKYLEALGIEFFRRASGMKAKTIYIGGGTPSCLEVEQLHSLMDLLDMLDPSCIEEFTVEANPGTLNMDKLLLLREAGVTRISLGVQSFFQKGLDTLGRFHSAKEARFAVAQLREAGFDNFSLDLIFAWPGQSLQDWEDDLRRAVDLGCPHISCYGLSYPEGTTIAKLLDTGKLQKLCESTELRMFNLARDVLAECGYNRYEISNFSLPGCESKHNINYWQGGTYIGLGAGAYSYEESRRTGNCTVISQYVDKICESGDAVDEVDEISPEARARECAAIWLRMSEGVDRDLFLERVGMDIEELLANELPGLLEHGWLCWDGEGGRFLRLTDRAVPLADSVLAEII